MLKRRIICTLLWGETGLVKPRSFGEHRKRGSMMDAVRVMNKRDIDELIILDVTATPNRRGPRFEELKEFTGEVYCPVTVGGGVTSVEDAVGLLNAGADKVAVGTANLDDPFILTRIAKKIGSQSTVAIMNMRLPLGAGAVAAILERRGAGEIMLVSVQGDGTMQGYDLDLIRTVARAVDVPVIASGGCSGYADMKAAFDAGADAVAAGALWQFTECTPRDAAKFLSEAGIDVRVK